jgi:hypothetical protein
MRLSSYLGKLGLAVLLLLGAAAASVGQEPSSGLSRQERRQDYTRLLSLPSPDRERIKKVISELSEEDAETQARLLQVARRYVIWLNHLSSQDRQIVEQAATLKERIQRIREIRERQWIATLTVTERERIESANKHGPWEQTSQAVLWSAARAAHLGAAPGVPVVPVPLLEERQRLIIAFKQRERHLDLERQLALNQGTERQEAMQRELQRIRRDLLDPNRKKPISPEDRQQIQQATPEDMFGYVRTLLDLARKYDVPLPEPPRVPIPDLIEFAKSRFTESVAKDYEARLKQQDPKQRQPAIAELTRLYWTEHPAKLIEVRQQEAKKRKDGKTGQE